MSEQNYNFYEFGPFRLDTIEEVLIRAGEPVHLTPKALKLLLILVRRSNHIVEKDELIRLVWPDTIVEESNLSGNIYTLRQILGEGNNSERYIETVPKRGYRFVATVHPGGQENSAENTSSSVHSTASVNTDSSKTTLRRNRALSGLGILIIGTVLTFYLWKWRTVDPEPGAPIRSIAVLPLKSLSEDEEDEYFADGFTEAMINELGKIAALRVISRTSVMQYKNARKTIPEIARELNVDAVLEGSVLQSDDRVRITAQLIRATTDEQLWAQSYERELSDVLELQSEIARGIAREIRIKLTPQEQAHLSKTHTVNPAAHEAYLKGLYYWNRAINAPFTADFAQLNNRSMEYFEQAIELEPNYAGAHAALANCYSWLASENEEVFYPKAKGAALEALKLDDNLAPAHVALATIKWKMEWDFTGAEREFKRAEELAPNSDNWAYAKFLSSLGRHDEGIQRFKRAQDLDPLTFPLKVSAGWTYVDARQYDNAVAQFRSILELAPDQFDANHGLGIALIFQGKIDEGMMECQKAFKLGGEITYKANLGWAYAMAGKQQEAREILAELESLPNHEFGIDTKIAMIYGALGEKDLAIGRLENAYDKRDSFLLWVKVDPRLDPLRTDERFRNLVRRIGFPE